MHTEESLMELAQAATVAAAKSPYLGENHYLVAQDVLRLAIREVLQDNEQLRKHIDKRAAGVDPLTQQLRERAEHAEAECERLREDLRGLEEVRREQAAGRDYWSAECERNRKDAERYRWAREEIYYKPPGYDGRKVGRWVWDWDFESENGTDLDAAIDADIAQEKQP